MYNVILEDGAMFFDDAGVKMYYERTGGGKPMLLLHGWGGKIASFLPVTRDFSAARAVYAVDFPGHGNSPEPPKPWSVTEYARLIEAFILRMGIAGCDVIAHSFGGRVALLLASTRPDLVGKMVLTGCAGLVPKSTGKRRLRARLYRVVRACADNGVTRRLFNGRVEDWREALVQRFGSADYRALSKTMRPTFNLVVGQDLRPCLARIQAPTLLIWGEQDADTPIWMGEIMEKEIPDAALIRLEGCGHFAYLERYADFKAIAWKFLIG